MKDTYGAWTLKDEEGILRPMAFLCMDNEHGRISKKIYEDTRLEEGQSIVEIKIEEV